MNPKLTRMFIFAARLAACAALVVGCSKSPIPTTTTTAGTPTTTVAPGTTVEVPDVSKLPIVEAVEVLEEAGFGVEFADDWKAGNITDLDTVAVQRPTAGEKLAAGEVVTLTRYGLAGVYTGADAEQVLAEESVAVILDFVDRVNRTGPGSGHRMLVDTDPYDGAVRGMLEVTEAFDAWVHRCYLSGSCDSTNWPTEVDLIVDPLLTPSEAPIISYGDGTYYVGAVYQMPGGMVGGYEILGGFRFYIDGTQPVLFDAVVWNALTDTEGVWLSTLWDRGGEVTVEGAADGVEVRVAGTGLRWWIREHLLEGDGVYSEAEIAELEVREMWSMWTLLEVTNSSGEDTSPYGFGVPLDGSGADSWRALFESASAEAGMPATEFNGVWGQRIPSGATAVVPVNVLFLPEQVSKDPGFVLGVFDGQTGGKVFDLRFSLSDVEAGKCGVGEADPAVLGVGECVGLKALRGTILGSNPDG